MTSERHCAICAKPEFARGWCSAHYTRWKRYGDPLALSEARTHPDTCTIEGCDRPYTAKDLCNVHYQRRYRRGSTEDLPKRTRTLCSVDGCDTGVADLQSGLCHKHRYRLEVHGSTADPRPSAEKRLLAKIRREPPPTDVSVKGDCWIWTSPLLAPRGHRRNGYGNFWFQGKTTSAHRASYTIFKGEIPEGLTIDHLCFRPACVNPDHLEAVTLGENVSRGWKRKKAQ